MSIHLDRTSAARVSGLRPTAVNAVLAEVRQLQAEGRALVSLMRGQPDTPTPAPIVEAAIKALRDGRTGYADNRGEPALRRAVADRLRRDQGLTYDPDREILITDGATLGLCAALGALLDPGGRVLRPDPIYDAYDGPIALWGGRPSPVPATLRDGRFTIERAALDLAAQGLLRNVRPGPSTPHPGPPPQGGREEEGDPTPGEGDVFKPSPLVGEGWVGGGSGRALASATRSRPGDRLLLLNTPWNPVGTVFTREELAGVMAFARDHDLAVLGDEIYEGLVYDGRRHVSPASVSDDARGRAIVINSLSKSYAMTGWRVGYCAGPEAVIGAMLLVLQQSSRGPATFVQDAAAVALAGDQASVAQMAAEYQGRRDLVVERLGGIPGVAPRVPEGGLFVMVDVRGLGRPSDEVRRSLLREEGVVVLHGSAYGPGGEGMLRVSFAAGGETLERGLDRLRAGLSRLAADLPPEGRS